MQQIAPRLSENILNWFRKTYQQKEFTADDSIKGIKEQLRETKNTMKNDKRNMTPLIDRSEHLQDLTPRSLKSVLKLTERTKPSTLTEHLSLKGKPEIIASRTVSASKIQRIAKACPAIKYITIEHLNLCSKKGTKQVNLSHFPKTLGGLSIRDSIFHLESFLNPSKEYPNIKVLDVGRSFQIPFVIESWPTMLNLSELYLEGTKGLCNEETFVGLLKRCPSLTVLDIEGTDIDDETLVLISKFSPNLKKLFIGFTGIGDRAFHIAENGRLKSMEVLCLADTRVSDYGVTQFDRIFPNLMEVTVNRATVQREFGTSFRINRVYNTHVGAVFRDEGCRHFELDKESRLDIKP